MLYVQCMYVCVVLYIRTILCCMYSVCMCVLYCTSEQYCAVCTVYVCVCCIVHQNNIVLYVQYMYVCVILYIRTVLYCMYSVCMCVLYCTSEQYCAVCMCVLYCTLVFHTTENQRCPPRCQLGECFTPIVYRFRRCSQRLFSEQRTKGADVCGSEASLFRVLNKAR